jgi:pyruvate/2-oxoglutarate dehydrogenase complex dihydrolipoamide acyltransferase (E2) component
MVYVLVPDLGDGIEKVEVALWHVKVGEFVQQDDDLVEVVTDKASFNIAAPADGMLRKITVPAGREAIVGEVLGEIE